LPLKTNKQKNKINKFIEHDSHDFLTSAYESSEIYFGVKLCSSDVIQNKSIKGYQMTGFQSKSNDYQNKHSGK
jgi:hypothetical protein